MKLPKRNSPFPFFPLFVLPNSLTAMASNKNVEDSIKPGQQKLFKQVESFLHLAYDSCKSSDVLDKSSHQNVQNSIEFKKLKFENMVLKDKVEILEEKLELWQHTLKCYEVVLRNSQIQMKKVERILERTLAVDGDKDTCIVDDEELELQNVYVKVMKDSKKIKCESLLPPVLNDTLRSGSLENSFYMDNKLVKLSSSYLNIENIFNFPRVVYLQTTKQSSISGTILAVSNPTEIAVTWNIHPMTMPVAQPFDDSIDSTRSAIEFLPTSGVLKPSETNNIVIEFLPGSVAVFSKLFELVLDCEGCEKQNCTIKIQGEAVADFPTILESRRSDIRDKKPTSPLKKKAKAEIFSETEICKFPATASGQKSTLKCHNEKYIL